MATAEYATELSEGAIPNAHYGVGGLPETLRAPFARTDLRIVHRQSAAGARRNEPADGAVPLEAIVDTDAALNGIVGRSAALHAAIARAATVAPTDSTVLISGETGTGKDLLARAIHKWSRRAGALVSLNCAAIPQGLIASELFGHEKGAFTGALQRRLGRFELAAGGTLFLDEIGDLPLDTQVALLRVLQEREFERIGGTRPVHADVRVVAATNRDLEKAIAAGAFRRDLYYRLNVFPIEIVPLRERRADIRPLVHHFVTHYACRAGKTIRSIDAHTLEVLEAYGWPGNIRELQNVVERSVIVCGSDVFRVDEDWRRQARETDSTLHRSVGVEREPLEPAFAPRPVWRAATLEEIERGAILEALRSTNGTVGGPRGAAALLGVKRTTLQARMRKLGIGRADRILDRVGVSDFDESQRSEWHRLSPSRPTTGHAAGIAARSTGADRVSRHRASV
jgi:transcriptional regulator with GAF, ATPase, and Fis domain